MNTNSLDFWLGIFLLFGAYLGFKKGLVYQLTSLIGLALGAYAATHFSEITASFLSSGGWVNEKYVNLVALLGTSVAVLVGINLLGKMLEKAMKYTGTEFLNTLGGIVFSCLKFIIIAVVVFKMIHLVNDKITLIKPESFQNSLIYTHAIEPFLKII